MYSIYSSLLACRTKQAFPLRSDTKRAERQLQIGEKMSGRAAAVATAEDGDVDGDETKAKKQRQLPQKEMEPTGVEAEQASPSAQNTTGMGSDVQELLECTVCTELLLDPVTTSCGHTFCRACLRQGLRHSNLTMDAVLSGTETTHQQPQRSVDVPLHPYATTFPPQKRFPIRITNK